jgi:hypothetical protein
MIGLGHKSTLHRVLQHVCFLLQELMSWPMHIRELVPPYLPHIYGWNDSCALGAGGILLPCTYWVPPMVWFIEYPLAIQQQLQEGHNQLGITVNDGKMVASLF